MASAVPPQLVFSREVPNLNDWATRTRIPLTTADALGKTYGRAHRWLLALKGQLISTHGWREAPTPDPRMLINIERSSPLLSQSGAPRTPVMRLQIPLQASSFFSPERLLQWQMVFHSATFPTLRKDVQPIADLLHVLQCLLTGMLVLVYEERLADGFYKTSRGLPPVEWVSSHQRELVDVFGQSHFKLLFKAAGDRAMSFKVEKEPVRR